MSCDYYEGHREARRNAVYGFTGDQAHDLVLAGVNAGVIPSAHVGWGAQGPAIDATSRLILWDATGDERIAQDLAQLYTDTILMHVPDNWRIKATDVQGWVREVRESRTLIQPNGQAPGEPE